MRRAHPSISLLAFCFLLHLVYGRELSSGQQFSATAGREQRRDKDFPSTNQAELWPLPSSSPRLECLTEYLLSETDLGQMTTMAERRTGMKLLKKRLAAISGVVPVCVRGRDGSQLALLFSSVLASEAEALELWPDAILLHRSKLVLFEGVVNGRSTAGEAAGCDLPEHVDAYGWRNASAVFAAFRTCRTTDNSGNMVWMYGALRLLDDTHTIARSPSEWLANLEPGSSLAPTAMLLSTANLLAPTFIASGTSNGPQRKAGLSDKSMDVLLSMTRIYLGRILALDLPSAILGIGVQVEFGDRGMATSGNSQGESLKLHPTQIELLAAVANRSRGGLPNIAVRGDLTQSVCRGSGVQACLSLGCPSLMINPAPDLGRRLHQKWALLQKKFGTAQSSSIPSPSPPLRLAFTMPAIYQNDHFAEALERIYVDAGRRFPDFIIVLQSGSDAEWVTRLRRSLKILDSQIHLFNSVPPWIEMLRSRDLVIGARIHGTMAATAAEVPTITIAKDYRITELAERMLLPMVHLNHMGETTIEALVHVGHARFSGRAFDANRAATARAYDTLLSALGVNTSPHIRRIAYP